MNLRHVPAVDLSGLPSDIHVDLLSRANKLSNTVEKHTGRARLARICRNALVAGGLGLVGFAGITSQLGGDADEKQPASPAEQTAHELADDPIRLGLGVGFLILLGAVPAEIERRRQIADGGEALIDLERIFIDIDPNTVPRTLYNHPIYPRQAE